MQNLLATEIPEKEVKARLESGWECEPSSRRRVARGWGSGDPDRAGCMPCDSSCWRATSPWGSAASLSGNKLDLLEETHSGTRRILEKNKGENRLAACPCAKHGAKCFKGASSLLLTRLTWSNRFHSHLRDEENDSL